jgi:hypothetical protein
MDIGRQDTPTDHAVADAGHRWTVFERTAVPAVASLHVASDGSRWYHLGAGEYICWSPGTRYYPPTVTHRGDIIGGLTSAG